MRNFLVVIFNLLIILLSVAHSQSIFSDLKAYQVGDIVTVLIVENANASRQSRTEKEGSASINADGSIKGNITGFLPVFGLGSATNTSNKGSAGTQQQDKITGKVSAKIIEKTPNGMFKIAGERLLEVNGETNLIQIEGYVRPRDINYDNTVYSYNLADAKIVYRREGALKKAFQPETLNRALTYVIGLGLIIAAIWGLGA